MLPRRSFLTNSLLSASAFLLPSGLSAQLSASMRRPSLPPAAGELNTLSARLKQITRHTTWTLINQIKVQFKTFHCQGMVKIGNEFWVSSVEMKPPVNGVIDRSSGTGHIFKIDSTGGLLQDIRLGEGAIFHPSGIDFDGQHIWVAAAEYRPDSRSIIYRLDPGSLRLQEMFRWEDHIGGIARNPDRNTLHGISWGSRRFYQWGLDRSGQLVKPAVSPVPAGSAVLNPAFYIDYQDNQYLGNQEMLYTGLNAYKGPLGTAFVLGGMELVNLDTHLPVHQVPVPLWSPVSGAPMTQNPSFFELTKEDKVHAYFIPDDNESIIYIYEVVS